MKGFFIGRENGDFYKCVDGVHEERMTIHFFDESTNIKGRSVIFSYGSTSEELAHMRKSNIESANARCQERLTEMKRWINPENDT